MIKVEADNMYDLRTKLGFRSTPIEIRWRVLVDSDYADTGAVVRFNGMDKECKNAKEVAKEVWFIVSSRDKAVLIKKREENERMRDLIKADKKRKAEAKKACKC